MDGIGEGGGHERLAALTTSLIGGSHFSSKVDALDAVGGGLGRCGARGGENVAVLVLVLVDGE